MQESGDYCGLYNGIYKRSNFDRIFETITSIHSITDGRSRFWVDQSEQVPLWVQLLLMANRSLLCFLLFKLGLLKVGPVAYCLHTVSSGVRWLLSAVKSRLYRSNSQRKDFGTLAQNRSGGSYWISQIAITVISHPNWKIPSTLADLANERFEFALPPDLPDQGPKISTSRVITTVA